MQATRTPTGSSSVQPIEVMYSQFVNFAKSGVVHSALVDESTSVLHFTIDQEKLTSSTNMPKRWYQRSAKTEKGKQTPTLRQLSTRVVDKDTTFVKVSYSPGNVFTADSLTVVSNACVSFT
jgi:hypothetical protein